MDRDAQSRGLDLARHLDEDEHCEVDGIAAPAVNSGRHGCSRGPGSLNGRSGAGEVANACGKDRDSDEYQSVGDDGADRVGRACPRNRARQRHQEIQTEAEQKRAEEESLSGRYQLEDATPADIQSSGDDEGGEDSSERAAPASERTVRLRSGDSTNGTTRD